MRFVQRALKNQTRYNHFSGNYLRSYENRIYFIVNSLGFSRVITFNKRNNELTGFYYF